MAKRTEGMSEVYQIPGAGYAVSILTDQNSYRRYVRFSVKCVVNMIGML